MSFEGIEEGVGGRGFMKERGVLGGSMFGETFLHPSTNAASSVGDAAKSEVENGRKLRPRPTPEAVVADRISAAALRRNIVSFFVTIWEIKNEGFGFDGGEGDDGF